MGIKLGNLAEAGAILLECGAVRMAGKSVAPTGGRGIGESWNAMAPAVNGRELPPPDDKVGAEIQQEVGVDVSGDAGSARLYRR